MDSIWSIILVFVWIVVMNLGGRFVKKFLGQDQNPENQAPEAPQAPEKKPSPDEVFRELRKKIEEARRQQQMERERDQMDAPEKQVVYKQREVISEREKRSSGEFQQALAKARTTEHDAEQHNLDQKGHKLVAEEENYPEFDLDLRNAIIGSIIMERPYK